MATWLRFGDPLGMVSVSKDLGRGANGVLTTLTRVDLEKGEDSDEGVETVRGGGTKKRPLLCPPG